jgi:hypothetical protein
MTTTFWLNNPSILLKQSELTELWPSAGMSMARKLNAITRLIIILTLFGYLVTRKEKFIVTGVITLGVIVLLHLLKADGKEGFIVTDAGSLNHAAMLDLMKNKVTEPSITNPAMNVLLTEINDNPDRNPAALAYTPAVEAAMNKSTIDMVKKNFNDPNIDEKLFKDLGDSFTFDQSMRTWYATANTQVTNDQGSFAEFCYGDMISCRDETNNEAACVRNAPPRWTNY